ncbi:MAG: AbrB/MazE/SpoVT family DNA-binding domain-containing protein [Eubacterium sp.]|nr:AbrB/MazE/SpoVT family DNA-binding domain-containing protein [Eubacterium sp.]
MALTKICRDGKGQLIRIPREYRFEENADICINKVGDSMIITPINKLKDSYHRGISMMTDDFMSEGRPEESDNQTRMRKIGF